MSNKKWHWLVWVCEPISIRLLDSDRQKRLKIHPKGSFFSVFLAIPRKLPYLFQLWPPSNWRLHPINASLGPLSMLQSPPSNKRLPLLRVMYKHWWNILVYILLMRMRFTFCENFHLSASFEIKTMLKEKVKFPQCSNRLRLFIAPVQLTPPLGV